MLEGEDFGDTSIVVDAATRDSTSSSSTWSSILGSNLSAVANGNGEVPLHSNC